jgi:tetratricopeptide (TPR) repeat protein
MSAKRPRRARGRPRAALDDGATSGRGIQGAALSPARRWLFRAILVAVPCLFFVAFELTLRAVGYGVPMDFALRQQVLGETRLTSNPYFTWLFFDPSLARLCPPFSLESRKPRKTCRIFVLGSSAAQGDPEPGFGLARMLEVLLGDQYRGVDLEVVNAATAAINSHVVYRMARASTRLEPDVFVLYTGNNEVVGPYGAGTTLTANTPDLRLLRASVAVRSTRVGQLLGAVVRGAVARKSSRGSWRGMEMFVEHQVRLGDPVLERTYADYERNLADTCRVARNAGVPVVLSTLVVNERSCAPFGSLHAAQLAPEDLARWERIYREGVQLEAQGLWAEASDRFRSAAQVDGGYAELEYRWARCCWNLAQHDDARQHYRRALDLDTLRFRADTRINEIVRRVGEREASRGARLVDAAQLLADAAPYTTPGDELLLDHVHLGFRGNYLLSAALLAEIQRVLPDWVRAQHAGRPVLSEQECARRLVYTDLDRYMIAETMAERLRQPPFTAQIDHAEQVERFARELATLRALGEAGAVATAVKEYEQALAAERPSWTVRERYAAIERRIGNASVAEREWRLLAGQFPQYPSFHLQLARALRDTGKHAEAEASLRTLLRYQPESSLVLAELARVVLHQGRAAEAISHARRAVALDPRDPTALHLLATTLCRRDSCPPDALAEATAHLTKALDLAPDSAAIRRDLTRAREALEGR